MIIFNNTSADIKTKPADVLLKIIITLIELRKTQLCFYNEWTLKMAGKLSCYYGNKLIFICITIIMYYIMLLLQYTDAHYIIAACMF